MNEKVFEIGDIVKIKKDCTIADIMENKWNNAHNDTLEFLTYADDIETTYKVANISKRGNVVIADETGDELYINNKLLEIVEHTKKNSFTWGDISKAIMKLLTK